MQGYRALAIATAIATYLLIVVGGVVRVTGSGLGCPDWPTCHGSWLPPLDPPALIEWSHRLLGGLTSPLILATTVGAWLWRRREPRVLVPATLVPVLLAVQIPLGGLVVYLEVLPSAVFVHLTFALLILGLLVWVAVAAGPRPVPAPAATTAARRLRPLVRAVVVATFGLVLVGGLTRATGAGFACVGFPDCNGQALPFGTSPLVDLHLTHRLLAYAVAALVAVAAVQSWRVGHALPTVRWAALGLVLLIGAQIAIGAFGVSHGLTPLARGLHLAGAAAVWAVAVLLAGLVSRATAAADGAAQPAAQAPRGEIAHRAPVQGY
ncbi:MAG TPA: COX15/CtaA family protein [Chloroflexota bacterium]|nr:COX15/CtaA family protein [Chloroflexota bacterium]